MRGNNTYSEVQGDRAAEKRNLALYLCSSVSLRYVFPPLLFYLAIAVVITWPLVTVLCTGFAGFPDGDTFEMGRHIWWIRYALQTGQPIFYQTALGYPDGIDGSVLLWANPLQFFPAWLLAFMLPLPAAYNVTQLLTIALNGWALFWLARCLTGREGAALLAGVAFMAAPTFQGHLAGGHGGLMVMWPVPLFLYALFQLRDHANRRWILLGALFFFLSPGGHVLQAIYVLLPIAAVFIIACIVRREWAWLRRGLLAMGLGAGALVLYLLPVAQATLTTPAYTDEGGFVRYSADLLAVITPSFFHPLFGNLNYTHRVLGVNIVEGSSYVGIIAGLLALLAVWWQPVSRWWLALAVVAWICSLGPLLKVFDQPIVLNVSGYDTHVTLPWAVVQNLPIFNLARTPARFNFALALALAVLAGYGAASVERRLAAWWAGTQRAVSLQIPLFLLAMILVLFEYQSFWPFPTTPAAVPEPVRALAGRGDIRAVFDIPWENVLAAKEALWLQTGHEQPLVAGQVTRRTPVSPAKLALLQATLDTALLDVAGADIVILHKTYDYDGALGLFAREKLGEPVYEDDRIAIFRAPQAAETPQFTALVTPLETVSTQADSYLYAPEPGWARLTGQLVGGGRVVQLLLDGQPVHTWTVDGELKLDMPVPVSGEDYHTLTLALNPPCPANLNPALECDSVGVSGIALGDFIPVALDAVRFERGLQLAGAYVQAEAKADEPVCVGLWWRFEQAIGENDIRFVHVLNEAGNLVAQADGTLGEHPAGSEWLETVSIALPADLPAATYRVYTGWYTYPDGQRFAVLTDVPGAENGLALVGTVEVVE